MNFFSSSINHFMRVLVLAVLVSGCVSDDISDLEEHVARVKKEEPLPLTPLPPFPPERIVLFDCEKDNPFEDFSERKTFRDLPALPEDELANPTAAICQRPDIYRNRQPLENFPLDSLAVVGTITLHGEIFGLIQEPQKKHIIHRVKVNDRLGENYGKIVSITERQIDVLEMLPIEDESGACFREEMRKIDITDANKSKP